MDDIQLRCRLCAAPSAAGSQLFVANGDRPPLAQLVNTYLPLKVVDNDNYPKTICPGCNIQLEATAQFLDLVVDGQNQLRSLINEFNSNNYNASELDGDHIIIQVLDDKNVYSGNHTISVRMSGIDKPKKKTGRPRKIKKPIEIITVPVPVVEEPSNGKRRRKPPKQSGVFTGKELKQILYDEGITDDDSDEERKKRKRANNHNVSAINPNEVIGHMQVFDGTNLTEPIVTTSKKKSRVKSTVHTCNICSMKFNANKYYLAHIATEHSQIIQQNNLLEKTDNIISDVVKTYEDESILTHNFESQMNNVDFTDNHYFDTGPSMPDITSDIISTAPLENDEKLNVQEMFGDANPCLDQVSNIISLDQDPVNILESVDVTNSLEMENFNEETPQIESKPSDGNKFACDRCDKVFGSKQSCNVHIKVKHLKQRPYKCKQCSSSFTLKSSLRKHLTSHLPSGEKGFACDLCGKVFNHPSSVLYHKSTAHNENKRFTCLKCNKVFKHRQLLRRHQYVHTNNRPFTCKICNATFKSKPNLINHLHTHSSVKKYICEICGRPFAHKNSLKVHARWHLGVKPFKCTVCNKAFCQNTNLVEHMRIHTNEEKRFPCLMCPRKFPSASKYRQHLERHKADQSLKCRECDEKFTERKLWIEHLRTHSSNKPFACDECDKRFVDRRSLRKHTRLHTGEKPFVCTYCGKAFADYSNLLRHKKSHEKSQMPEIAPNSDLTSIDETINSVLDNQVLCISFNTEEDTEEPPTFHIVNENGINDLNNCEFYQNENDLLSSDVAVINDPNAVADIQAPSAMFDQFVDKDGNPIQFTLQDNVQFAVTSSDGILLQIQNEELILNNDMQEVAEVTEELVESTENMPNGQSVKFLTSLDDAALAQYFMIV